MYDLLVKGYTYSENIGIIVGLITLLWLMFIRDYEINEGGSKAFLINGFVPSISLMVILLFLNDANMLNLLTYLAILLLMLSKLWISLPIMAAILLMLASYLYKYV